MSDNSTKKIIKNEVNKIMYIDMLISEVKKRGYLYDKRHEHYGNRGKVAKGWQAVADILKKQPDEVKAKWRNLKDSFHRLEKKIEFPTEEGKPIESFYSGQWVHFEKLLFLRDTRQNKNTSDDYMESDVPEISVDDTIIKGEFDLTTRSMESDEENNDVNSEPVEQIYAEPIITLQSVLNSAAIGPNTDQSTVESRKRVMVEDFEEDSKRRLIDYTSDAVIDEDLHFVKSLVPFLRKLNPIRKLIVRNEMQNLLIKEMLCENCRSFGPQPNCRCSL